MTPANAPHHERRRVRRKSTRRGTTISCRKGTLGLGPNLAISIHDLGEEGMSLLVKEWITPPADVEIAFTAVGTSKPTVVIGQVVWCNPMQTGFLIGVKFRERIAYMQFTSLT